MRASTSTHVDAQDRLWVAALEDRGVLSISGPDASHLLQGLLTQDMGLLDRQPAIYAALLSPQGKILFDFLLARQGDAYLVDCRREVLADLTKRLALYKLRAKVTFSDASDKLRVFAIWGGGRPPASPREGLIFADPRLAALGWRALVPRTLGVPLEWDGEAASVDQWHAHRIALGVPDGGLDFAYGDAFPHEADMDQLAGVSFTKGCYVGQEVVSRMQHRGTARKRIVIVRSAAPLSQGAPIVAGDISIGSVASSAGEQALALLRLDRAAEAKAKALPMTTGGVPVEMVLPPWAQFSIAPQASREAGT